MKSENQIKVLVVDDEQSVCETLRDYLEDYGYMVSSAGNSGEALALLDKEVHDVALIDMRLPLMNGDALVLKAHALQPELRFLIHTGSSVFHLPEELRRIGIRPEHVFLKPVRDLSLLRDAIKNLVEAETEDDVT